MKSLKKLFWAALLLLILGQVGARAFMTNSNSESRVIPSGKMQNITTIEAKLKMPNGTRPLVSYVRYYANVVEGNHRYVNATYVHDGISGRIVVVDVDKLPRIFDGGCDVIELRYDLDQEKFIFVRCGGVA